MDSETSQAFAKVLEYLVNSIGGVIDENSSDMTEYIKSLGSEIVAYKLGIAYLWLGVAVFIGLVGVGFIVFSLLKKDLVASTIGVAIIFFAFIIGMINTYTVITCKTFPEKVIMDYIQEEYNSITSTYR